MDQGPLVNEEIAATDRFLAEFNKSYPVQVAFWFKDSDTGNWFLYVVSEQITDENFDVAYGEVGRIDGERRDPWFDCLRVKVLGRDEPLAKAVTELRHRYPSDKPARFFSQTVGGMEADEIYVYPSPLPAAVG